jgi:putative ABC transport system permease protein
MGGLIARARSLWHWLRHPAEEAADMDEEMRFHMEQEAERLVRERGLDIRQARRQARLAFGSMDRYQEEGRAVRGVLRLRGLSLDFRLGLRMLVRYPGLTLVAGVAMTFAIAIGAATFEFLRDAMYPVLPVAEGERVVRLHQVDAWSSTPVGVTPAELEAWRKGVRGVREIGGYRGVSRVLWLGEGSEVAVDGLSVSASAFTLAGVAPLHGRLLLDSDEVAGAESVMVLSHALWRSRLAADPDVVGRWVQLGGTATRVVGVLPAGFAFPVAAEVYVPLRLDELGAGGHTATIMGFGRLADGVATASAQAEIEAMSASLPGSPNMGEHPGAVVEAFAYPLVSTGQLATSAVFALLALMLALMMVVVCANVALLLYARAATREAEIAVRSALGASRLRIVGQLFVEALVLAGLAVTAGLLLASMALRRALALVAGPANDSLPLWIGDTLSPVTILWALLLALLGAAVAGIAPGLQVTRRKGAQAGLQRTAGRGTGARMGHLWTGIVVGQVALTVAFMPVVLLTASLHRQLQSAEPGVAAGEYLVAQLEADGDPAGFASGWHDLRLRLAGEPAVRGVTLASHRWPGWRSDALVLEDDLAPPADINRRRAQHIAVDAGFFVAMGARVVAGRAFTDADAGAQQPVIIVSESFVREVLDGRNAIGRRIRIDDPRRAGGTDATTESGRWHEVIGVVADLGMNPHSDLPHAGVVYHALTPSEVAQATLIVHAPGTTAAFGGRLRILALQSQPPLRLTQPMALDRLMEIPALEMGAWLRVVAIAGAIALLLTLTGIYAVVSFTVSRRTREIGVRVALGADAGHVARAILARAAAQVGGGIAVGGGIVLLLAIVITQLVEVRLPPPHHVAGILGLYLATMASVCLLACAVPLRRALRVQPTEALSADA